jgi:acetyl-CoA synthetase
MHTSPPPSFEQSRQFLLAHRNDYAAAVAGFRWPPLQHFNWALDHFDRIAYSDEHSNEATALWLVDEDGSEERISYAAMARRSNQVANWLHAQGVQRGDRVLLMLGNERALWEAMLGLMKLGAVLIPATTLLSGEDLLDRLDRGQVRHVIAGHGQTAKFDALTGNFTRIAIDADVPGWLSFTQAYQQPEHFTPSAPTRADDPLLLYFTSGTTSKPKLVLHSQQSYPVGHLSTMYWLGLRPGDVHLNISSPGWGKHAWSSFFAPWNAGACIFIYNYQRLSPTALLDVVVKHGVSSFCAPPTVWRMLIQQDLKAWPVKLREVIGAGEPLNPEIIDRVQQAWGLNLRDGFGQTETTCLIGNSPGQPIKPGSMGRPMPGFDIRLLDPQGQPAQEGEVCVGLSDGINTRPTGLMLGYVGDSEKTDAVMHDGVYHTGDVAQRDAQGFITYVGRADDVFKSADYRISPFELESVLIEHPWVAEAAVVPSPDPIRLTVPKAFVVLREGTAPSRDMALDILRFARDKLAPFKRIRRLEFAALPKTISGKIQRAQLRQQEAQHVAQGTRAAHDYREEDFTELGKPN